jgi:hypothetical protein
VNNRVNPHAFSHARARHLASYFTKALLGFLTKVHLLDPVSIGPIDNRLTKTR